MSQYKINNFFIGVCITSLFFHTAYAKNISFGNPDSDLGQVSISGYLRGNIQDKNFSDNEHKLKFDAAKLIIKYDNPSLFGEMEYRCYQFDKICDFSSLVNAYVGYKINQTSNIKFGMQDIPFGIGRDWSTNWYGDISGTLGVRDVHNLGISYHTALPSSTQIDAAYFFQDGNDYTGKSKDSARYSANFVQPDDPSQTYLKEKNMMIIRVSQDIPTHHTDLKVNIGGSYWYSELENKTFDSTGHRNAWAAFSQINYKDARLILTAGQNKVTNKDPIHPDYSVMGSFDSDYYVANKGNFYTVDLSYTFRNLYGKFNFTPYATYSSFIKDEDNYDNSTRNILGLQLDYKNYSIVGEYIIGKNDAGLNGTKYSYVQGDDEKTGRMLNILFLYYF